MHTLFHRTDSKDPDIHVLEGNKVTQRAPSTRTECEYLYGWIKTRLPAQKSHPKWFNSKIKLETEKKKKKEGKAQRYSSQRRRIVNPRDIAGNAEDLEEW